MKRYLFALLLLALTFSAQAQNQNVYRFSYTVDSLPGGVIHYQEIPATLLSLWTLGGSFDIKNLGDANASWSVTVEGTSDPLLASNAVTGWQTIKTVSQIGLTPGTTSYQNFRTATEMFYLGHTRVRVVIYSSIRPVQFNGYLVLKKR